MIEVFVNAGAGEFNTVVLPDAYRYYASTHQYSPKLLVTSGAGW